MNSPLKKILEYFKENKKVLNHNYHVPSLWLSPTNKPAVVRVKYANFFIDVIENIIQQSNEEINYLQPVSSIHNQNFGGGFWTYQSTIYNLFVRYATAFDHDNDGKLGSKKGDITLDKKQRHKEGGTLLKSIALLPYIQYLGSNTLHLMPITKIGQDGNKGDLGSPYSIRNPYAIDESIVDPNLPFTAEEQLAALIEAAHRLNLRVVLEFVLRTASLDSDWVKDHPDWFYWIKKSEVKTFSKPEFTSEELEEIHKIPNGNGFHIQPSEIYKSKFYNLNGTEKIKLNKGKWQLKSETEKAMIPNGFSDWPPEDSQPAWSDVTYLRMYKEPEQKYNYLAYDTMRYYNPELAQQSNINRPLWDALKGVIPYYQTNFGIDGVMLDMGHALPQQLSEEIVREARTIDADFAFIEENFSLDWESRNKGFNAALGYEWSIVNEGKEGLLKMIRTGGFKQPFPFLGSAETHNTPRASQSIGNRKAKQFWILNNFLPNCIPFIHNGYELFEKQPVNTGLNFTKKELKSLKNSKLPLFYQSQLNWLKKNNMVDFMHRVAEIRKQYQPLIANGDETSIRLIDTDNEQLIAFERFKEGMAERVLIILNVNEEKKETFNITINYLNYNNIEILSGKKFNIENGLLSGKIEKSGSLIFHTLEGYV